MKKTTLIVLVFILTAGSSCLAAGATFEVKVEEIGEVMFFETNQIINLYDGGQKIVPHVQYPSDGSKYVLANVTVAKNGDGAASVNLSKLALSVDGKRYNRIDDGFLPNHNYRRLPGYSISFGSKSGYVCFMIPVEQSIANAKIVTGAPESENDERMKGQVEVENKIISEYRKGNYGIDSPFIIQDPYSLSPLSALVMFKTETPTRISMLVKGRDKYTDVSHMFTELSTEHEIPIYGLYPGTKNEVTLTATAESGEEKQSVLYIETEALPSDFSKVRVSVKKEGRMAPGFTFFDCPHNNGNYPLAIDGNGDVRWYLTDKSMNCNVMLTHLKNGNLMLGSGKIIPNTYGNLYSVYEITPMGKIIREYSIYGIHHDIREKPDGNLLFCTSMEGRASQNDYIVEVERGSGNILRTWDLMRIIPMTAYDTQPPYSGGLSNWLHHNALWYLEYEDSFIISGRHQNLVLKFDAKTEEIKWAFSATIGELNEKLRPYLLRPVSDNFEYPCSQHAAMILPDKKLFLFDNRNYLEKPMDGAKLDQTLLYSRAVIYEIDENERTVKEIWQYGKERGAELYSSFASDVDYLGENHYLINFGGMYKAPDGSNYDHMFTPAEIRLNSSRPSVVVEILNNEVVFEAMLYGNANSNSYKAERKQIYLESMTESAILLR